MSGKATLPANKTTTAPNRPDVYHIYIYIATWCLQGDDPQRAGVAGKLHSALARARHDVTGVRVVHFQTASPQAVGAGETALPTSYIWSLNLSRKRAQASACTHGVLEGTRLNLFFFLLLQKPSDSLTLSALKPFHAVYRRNVGTYKF